MLFIVNENPIKQMKKTKPKQSDNTYTAQHSTAERAISVHVIELAVFCMRLNRFSVLYEEQPRDTDVMYTRDDEWQQQNPKRKKRKSIR